MYFLIIPPSLENDLYIRTILQILSGLIAYLKVKQNKLSITLAN